MRFLERPKLFRSRQETKNRTLNVKKPYTPLPLTAVVWNNVIVDVKLGYVLHCTDIKEPASVDHILSQRVLGLKRTHAKLSAAGAQPIKRCQPQSILTTPGQESERACVCDWIRLWNNLIRSSVNVKERNETSRSHINVRLVGSSFDRWK